MIDLPIQVAPMVGVTTPHFNRLMRLITPRFGLYTEMISTHSIRHGFVLDRMPQPEANTVIQLAGNCPDQLAYCAQLAERRGFVGVNLNVGCPSGKIKKAQFGAILFKYPALVAACAQAMKESVQIPVSVKTRIGVDDCENYQYLARFVEMLLKSGCDEVVIHARKAYLKGLSPKANRNVPPLRYSIVQQLMHDFPEGHFVLNGGIDSLDRYSQLKTTFSHMMIGRAIDRNPFLLRALERDIYGDTALKTSRQEVLSQYMHYAFQQSFTRSHIPLLKPLMGLFHATPFAKTWHKKIIDCFSKKQKTPLADMALL